jgi:beta-fructofuranosidase
VPDDVPSSAPTLDRDASARRPTVHITAPRNWLNDPNGPIRHGGRYHLFYQHNPAAPVWGAPHWGHVSSPDLVTWTDHPVALAPRPEGPDRDGCWSGCARLIEGRPTLFYTGVVEMDGRRTESVCVAHGSQDLLHWERPEQPLIPGAPPDITGGYHRDPFLFETPDGWRMLLGSGLIEGQRRSGAVLLYGSRDLIDWEYRGVVHRRPAGAGPIDTGPIWECPQLLRSAAGDALIFSVQMEGDPDPLRKVVYAFGRLGDGGFEERALGLVDHGNAFYAPAVTFDGGRNLMWGWIQEKRRDPGADHSGALSLPRVVNLVDGRLCVSPAPELAGLRSHTLAHKDLVAGQALSLVEPVSLRGAFELTCAAIGPAPVSIELVAQGRPVYALALDPSAGIANVSAPGTSPVTLPLPAGQVRLFVDASIYELFLDDEVAVTTRAYGPEATELRVSGGPQARLRDVSLHVLRECLPGRRRRGDDEAY